MDFLRGSSYPFDAKILQTPRLQEIFLRLQRTRIPRHPINKAGARAITEVLQAWKMYAHLCEAAPHCGDAFLHTLLTHLPDAWEWALFLLPGQGNVMEIEVAELYQFEAADFPLREDGTVAVGVRLRYWVLVLMMVALFDEYAGRAACVALPRFGEVLMAVATYDWVKPLPRDGVQVGPGPMHRLYDILCDLLEDKDAAIARRMLRAVVAHEEREPGKTFLIAFERIQWHMDTPLASRDPDYISTTYTDVIKNLLDARLDPASPLQRLFLETFRRANGVSLTVKLLLKMVPDGGVPVPHKEERSVAMLCVALLDALFQSGARVREVVRAIKAGLLLYMDRLLRFVPMGVGDAMGEDWRRTAMLWMQRVLLPSLTWPKVLCAYREQAVLYPRLMDQTFVSWPMWHMVNLRFSLLHPRWELCEARLKQKEVACSNPNCDGFALDEVWSGVKSKICECALVSYCSKRCQKMHWRAGGGHRQQCSRPMRDLTMLPLPDSVKPLRQPTMTYVDFHFIRTSALYEIALALERGTLIDRRPMTVEFLDVNSDGNLKVLPVTAGDDGPPLAEGTMRVYGRLHWGTNMEADVLLEQSMYIEDIKEFYQKVKKEDAARRAGLGLSPG